MKIQQILKYWMGKGEQISSYTLSQLTDSRLTDETIQFLNECGLPSQCAPGLDFPNLRYNSIPTPNEIFNIDFPELNDYLMVGSNGSGDPVCIDLNNKNQIVFLNHDDFFARIFINSNIEMFAECLIAYSNFISLTNAQNHSNFINARFSNEDFQDLMQTLMNVDIRCLDNNTMWRWELDGLLWEKNKTTN